MKRSINYDVLKVKLSSSSGSTFRFLTNMKRTVLSEGVSEGSYLRDELENR